MTGFMKRHGLAYAKIREAIQADRFQPGAGLLKYGHWPCGDIREMLMFMSIHIIDLAVSFFGKPASVTSASCRRNRDGALTLAVTLRFQSGRLAQLVLDSGQPRIQERVEISGMMDGGSAMYVVDNVQHMELHRQGSNGIDLLAPTMQEISPAINLDDIRVWRPDYGIPNMGQTRLFFQGFAGEVREFVNAVNEHREPYPGMDDAREAMRIVEAISATPDGVVELR
jgi:predicted dehydrogenase